jgi:Uncharacterized conserved protein, contains double-stranded beta-helix domain
MDRPIHYPTGPSPATSNDKVPKKDMGDGRLVQVIGEGGNLNAVHWNIPDGRVVPSHEHPAEQLGYVVRGRLELTTGEETFLIEEGDSYVLPPNVPHGFRAVGDVEAIDVFSPPRDLSTIGGQR